METFRPIINCQNYNFTFLIYEAILSFLNNVCSATGKIPYLFKFSFCKKFSFRVIEFINSFFQCMDYFFFGSIFVFADVIKFKWKNLFSGFVNKSELTILFYNRNRTVK